MTDDLSESLRELRNSTKELNALTDKANDRVQRIERFLVQECSVGGEAHVHVKSMDKIPDIPNAPEWSTYLGFERYGGSHRIVVTHLLEGDPRETKPWAECKRNIKVQSLEALPELIAKLSDRVRKQVTDLEDTIQRLDSMALLRSDSHRGSAQ